MPSLDYQKSYLSKSHTYQKCPRSLVRLINGHLEKETQGTEGALRGRISALYILDSWGDLNSLLIGQPLQLLSLLLQRLLKKSYVKLRPLFSDVLNDLFKAATQASWAKESNSRNSLQISTTLMTLASTSSALLMAFFALSLAFTTLLRASST